MKKTIILFLVLVLIFIMPISSFASGNAGESESDGIIDFLLNFFDNLLNFFVSIIIPSDGYFTDWFNEIKTAFEAKLGGLGVLFTSFLSIFESLGNCASFDFILTVPDNSFFSGFDGMTVEIFQYVQPLISFLRGIFNVALVVFTFILIYRQIIMIIKT